MAAVKTLIIAFVVAVSFVFTYVADGGVVGSKHDISTAGTPEPCVFCHTPHSASATLGAPLWNRFIGPGVTFTPYTRSSTMTSTPGQPGPVSLACLSCHDGVIAGNDKHTLLNAPGPGIGDTTSEPNCNKCHTEFVGGGISMVHTPGTDLRNDHPISMSYPLTNPNLHLPPNAQTGWPGNDLKLYGGVIECPTCHDVHNPNTVPFLRKSNDASIMCLTCHIK